METWCGARRCEDDLSLSSEWEAIREALANFEELKVVGGVILVHGKVEAFTVGELLNKETVVVHIEKANMEIRGLYNMINQQFLEKQWQDIPYVNREQDLGEPGLREAKLSYNPEHFVEKYRIRLSRLRASSKVHLLCRPSPSLTPTYIPVRLRSRRLGAAGYPRSSFRGWWSFLLALNLRTSQKKI